MGDVLYQACHEAVSKLSDCHIATTAGTNRVDERKCYTYIFRSAFSFVAWSVWCGPSIQKMIMSATLWVYVHLEAEYGELFNTTAYSVGTYTLVSVTYDLKYFIE